MPIWDISRPLSPALAPWPGDAPFVRSAVASIARGDRVNLSAISLSLHLGTHVDAPCHFLLDGATLDALDQATFLGPAVVVDVTGKPVVHVADLIPGVAFAPRVLLKTNAWQDSAVFPQAIPALDPRVPECLKAHGVVLLGVDVPSVDRFEDADLPIHHALGERGIVILESLDLSAVDPGFYEIATLPLRIPGADGSPVRAVLYR